jgi:hypothetical protein
MKQPVLFYHHVIINSQLVSFSLILLGLSLLSFSLWLFPVDEKQSLIRFSEQRSHTSTGFKILVSIISTWPGRPLEMIYRCLDVFEKDFAIAGHEVHVCFDTNSDELAKVLSNRPPTQSTREVRVWSLEALEGDPMYLPHVHRKYWEEHETGFDFFIYIEDDILFSIASFNVYVERRKALQEKGWVFGWVRVEKWGVDNKTLVVVDNKESRADVNVFETPDGNLWAQPWMPYSAQFVLDRDELRRVIEDPSGFWITGFPGFDKRSKNNNLYTGTEVMSIGFQYKYSGNQLSSPEGARGWQSRSLVPVSRDCKVEQPGGIVHHMPSKYAKSTNLLTNYDCVEWLAGKWASANTNNLLCIFGQIPLSRLFLCGEVQPIPLPMWPEGAALN